MIKKNVWELLKENPNACHVDGRSHLYIASRYGHYTLVKHALKYGADPNGLSIKRDPWDMFFGIQTFQPLTLHIPLFIAVIKEHISIMTLLIQKGADVNVLDNCDVSPLFYAVMIKNEAATNVLLDAGAKPRFRGPEGYSPIDFAIEHNITPIVEIFIQRDFHLFVPGVHENGMMHSACFFQQKGILKRLLQLGLDPNIDYSVNRPLLITAIRIKESNENGFRIVKTLLKAGADPNFHINEEDIPIIVAAKYGLFNIVKLLLMKGANPNVCDNYGNTPLILACSKSNYEIVELLLAAGAKHDVYTKLSRASPLMFAKFDYEIVKLLLAAGADINHQELGGYTILMHVAAAGYYRIFIFLLAVGADPNITDVNEDTALSITKRNKFEQFTNVLQNVPLPLQSICICKIELEKIKEKLYRLSQEFIL